jgi:hypothetical protein
MELVCSSILSQVKSNSHYLSCAEYHRRRGSLLNSPGHSRRRSRCRRRGMLLNLVYKSKTQLPRFIWRQDVVCGNSSELPIGSLTLNSVTLFLSSFESYMYSRSSKVGTLGSKYLSLWPQAFLNTFVFKNARFYTVESAT